MIKHMLDVVCSSVIGVYLKTCSSDLQNGGRFNYRTLHTSTCVFICVAFSNTRFFPCRMAIKGTKLDQIKQQIDMIAYVLGSLVETNPGLVGFTDYLGDALRQDALRDKLADVFFGNVALKAYIWKVEHDNLKLKASSMGIQHALIALPAALRASFNRLSWACKL